MLLELVLIGCESLLRRHVPIETARGFEVCLFLPSQIDLVQFLPKALVVGDKLGPRVLILSVD